MQSRLWDFQAPDSTDLLNQMALALSRRASAGSAGAGLLRPGRVCGFYAAANAVPDDFIDLTRDGSGESMLITPQGVVVVEDGELDDPVQFAVIGAGALPRIDIVVVKHSYIGSLPNAPATYAVIIGTDAANPVPDYASVAADETPIAEVYIDPAPGAGNPPVAAAANIRVLPAVHDRLTADHEPAWGRSNNEFGAAGIWARMGRNADRFYMMRDPDDDNGALLVLNAYHQVGVQNRSAGADGVSNAGLATFDSASSDFIAAGVRPGDTLTITAGALGADVGVHTVASVNSAIQLSITGVFVGDTVQTFSIDTAAGVWYQEDVTRRSTCIRLADSVGGADSLFGAFYANAGTLGSAFGVFWSQLVEARASGDLVWPNLYGTKNTVYGAVPAWTSVTTFTVGAGSVFTNGKFRENGIARVVDITAVYNAGVTDGRLPAEALANGWWYVYATADFVGAGWGVALSQTAPNAYTLQHPANADLRWIGEVYYDLALARIRKFARTPAGYVAWLDNPGRYYLTNSATLLNVNVRDGVPETSRHGQFSFYLLAANGSARAHLGVKGVNVAADQGTEVAIGTSSTTAAAHSSANLDWPVSSDGFIMARRGAIGVQWMRTGYYVEINAPIQGL